jgi:23S rRNA (cytosine1962-C5)-methyltransferase
MQDILHAIHQYFSELSPDAGRIFHGRGHCFPGFENLVIDCYPPAILVSLFAEVDQDVLQSICDTLRETAPAAIDCLVIQRRYLEKAPREIVYGELPADHHVSESGILFKIGLDYAQNTGLFLDMKSGRQWLTQKATGKRVLNLFSYTCSLSVAALAGAAERVVNFDMSRQSLNTGRENHRLNGMDMSKVEFFANDIRKSWGRICKKGPYDLIIIDPPSFQKGSFDARKDYRKIVRRIPKFASAGAVIFAALNSPDLECQFLRDIFLEELPGSRFIDRIPSLDSFPEKDPERNLKLLLCEM